MNMLSIAQHIYTTLHSDEAVGAIVGERIYPIASRVETSYPLIVYSRDSISVTYDKSGKALVTSNVSVDLYAETYNGALELGEAVVAALDRKTASYAGLEVIDCIVTGAAESIVEGVFSQTIYFQLTSK